MHRLLGRGGSASVYLAEELALERPVAIKVIAPQLAASEDVVARFYQEAKTAASLNHPNIIPVYTQRRSSNLAYFVMRHVDGVGLDVVIRQHGRLPLTLARAILSQVASALQFAHKKGVVHRDVKPSNIMLDAEGASIVTDFGIAKIDSAKGLTATGAVVGTPYYMSPEQISGREVTGKSDQYSLGVVAYEMLCGQLPFDGDSVVTLMKAHLWDAPAPLLDARNELSPAVAAAVMRMLAKAPDERWPDLTDFVRALDASAIAADESLRSQITDLARTSAQPQVLPSVPLSPIVSPQQSGLADDRVRPRVPAAEAELGAAKRAEAARQEEAVALAERQREAERLAVALRAAERLTAEKEAAERRAEEERRLAERALAAQASVERFAAERSMAERLAAERAMVERIAADRVVAERALAERLAAEWAAAEKAANKAAEKAAEERLASERAAAEGLASERETSARLSAAKSAAERRASEAELRAEAAERMAAETSAEAVAARGAARRVDIAAPPKATPVNLVLGSLVVGALVAIGLWTQFAPKPPPVVIPAVRDTLPPVPAISARIGPEGYTQVSGRDSVEAWVLRQPRSTDDSARVRVRLVNLSGRPVSVGVLPKFTCRSGISVKFFSIFTLIRPRQVLESSASKLAWVPCVDGSMPASFSLVLTVDRK